MSLRTKLGGNFETKYTTPPSNAASRRKEKMTARPPRGPQPVRGAGHGSAVAGDGPLFSFQERCALEGKDIAVRLFVDVLFCIGGYGLYGTVRYGRSSVVRIGNIVWCENGISGYLSEYVRIWLNLVEFVRIWLNCPFTGCSGWFGANPGRSLQALSAPGPGMNRSRVVILDSSANSKITLLFEPFRGRGPGRGGLWRGAF